MNRRQFLTGVSAAAVASALPAVPAMQAWGETITSDELLVALWKANLDAAYELTARAIVDTIYRTGTGVGSLHLAFPDKIVLRQLDSPPHF